MPLRDHFRPPLHNIASWQELHGQWPAVIVIDLNRKLPPRYAAGPRVQLGAFYEINVSAYEEVEPAFERVRNTVVEVEGRVTNRLDQRIVQSLRTKEGIDPLFTLEGLGRTGEMYIAGQDPNQPLLAPAVCADLAGFPPILLQAGSDELLLDDSVRLAERAREADVDVILDITAGAPHVFQVFTETLDEAVQALDRAALFLTQHLNAR